MCIFGNTFFIACLILLVTACAGKQVTLCHNGLPDNDCSYQRPLLASVNENEIIHSSFAHEPWSKKGTLPSIGLALSGGGSRSAPVAMGVLKRFVDNGWIDQVDLISSVSGGGYAAYYLYSKALYQSEQPNEMIRGKRQGRILNHVSLELRDFFTFSMKYARDKNNKVTYESVDYSDQWDIYDETCQNFGDDASRFQKRVMCYQDILSPWPAERLQGDSHGRVIRDTFVLAHGFLQTAVMEIAHIPANILFDWNIRATPTQYLYQAGIERAYGNSRGKFSFAKLQKLIESRKLPLWIINTAGENSSGFGAYWWGKSNSLSDRVFELTPYDFGSNKYHYVNQTPDILGINVLDAVLASAAFFDSHHEKFFYRAIGHPILQAFNARWGIDIRNYNASDFSYLTQNILPAPLYFIKSSFGRSPQIHLSDGGQSGDNLGIYSLLRRGTRNIVAVQGSYTGSKKTILADLCSVQKYIQQQGYSIVMDGKPNTYNDDKFYLSKYCALPKAKKSRFSLKNWKKPVWHGEISTDMPDGLKVTNLWFIQAAVDIDKLQNDLNSVSSKEQGMKCEGTYAKEGGGLSVPCNLIRFYQFNVGDCVNGERRFTLPGTKTVGITLDSSQSLYSGLLSLGYYLAGYLNIDNAGKISLEPYAEKNPPACERSPAKTGGFEFRLKAGLISH